MLFNEFLTFLIKNKKVKYTIKFQRINNKLIKHLIINKIRSDSKNTFNLKSLNKFKRLK